MKLELTRIPPSLNELRKKGHFAYRDLRLAWEKDLWICTGSGEKSLELQRQASWLSPLAVTVHVYRRRELDYDNLVGGMKPVLDALVNIGYLRDDSPQHITVTYLQASPFKPRTVITIEPEK
jgi:hypothetical protein